MAFVHLVLSTVLSAAHADDAVAVADHRTSFPAALAPRPFQLPEAQTARLSNGLEVLVVENHEVPLVYVNVVFASGAATDPAGREGLASVAMELVEKGAGNRSAEELSVAARKLGAELSTFAGNDSSGLGLQVLKRNVGAGLDLLADLTLRPTFPEAEWTISQKRRIQDLSAIPSDPRRVAARVFDRLMHGDAYIGLFPTLESYSAMNTAEMRAWYTSHARPDQAIVLVGGDTTLDEVVPLLEARFAGWTADGAAPPAPEIPAEVPSHPPKTVYLHDMPGTPQSIVKMGAFVMDRTAPDATAFVLANRAYGGQFMSRLNLNLREDKGWTYGARSGIDHSLRPGVWSMDAGIKTSATAAAVQETFRELDGLLQGGVSASGVAFGAMDADELNLVRDGLIYTWPLSFENPGQLLGDRLTMWRYNLPDDWLSGYTDRLRAVSLDAALDSWKKNISRDDLVILIVGDSAVVRPELEAAGLSVVPVDAEGKVLAAPASAP